MTYGGVERSAEKGRFVPHTIQILGERRQILALWLREKVSMLFPVNKVAESLVKLRRGFVGVVKLLQWIGRDHRVTGWGNSLCKYPARR